MQPRPSPEPSTVRCIPATEGRTPEPPVRPPAFDPLSVGAGSRRRGLAAIAVDHERSAVGGGLPVAAAPKAKPAPPRQPGRARARRPDAASIERCRNLVYGTTLYDVVEPFTTVLFLMMYTLHFAPAGTG